MATTSMQVKWLEEYEGILAPKKSKNDLNLLKYERVRLTQTMTRSGQLNIDILDNMQTNFTFPSITSLNSINATASIGSHGSKWNEYIGLYIHKPSRQSSQLRSFVQVTNKSGHIVSIPTEQTTHFVFHERLACVAGYSSSGPGVEHRVAVIVTPTWWAWTNDFSGNNPTFGETIDAEILSMDQNSFGLMVSSWTTSFLNYPNLTVQLNIQEGETVTAYLENSSSRTRCDVTTYSGFGTPIKTDDVMFSENSGSVTYPLTFGSNNASLIDSFIITLTGKNANSSNEETDFSSLLNKYVMA